MNTYLVSNSQTEKQERTVKYRLGRNQSVIQTHLLRIMKTSWQNTKNYIKKKNPTDYKTQYTKIKRELHESNKKSE